MLPDQFGRKQRGEPDPVCPDRVLKPINRVLLQICVAQKNIRICTAIAEDQAKQVFNNGDYRNTLFFVCIALLQNL